MITVVCEKELNYGFCNVQENFNENRSVVSERVNLYGIKEKI